MSREEVLKRQTQYGSADGEPRVRGPRISLYAKSCPTLIICVRAGCVRQKKVISMLPKHELGFVESGCIHYALLRQGIYRNIVWCGMNRYAGSELIFCNECMSVRLPEKSLQDGSADWWNQKQRLYLEGMSVKGGKDMRVYTYMHLQLLLGLTFFAPEAHSVILGHYAF